MGFYALFVLGKQDAEKKVIALCFKKIKISLSVKAEIDNLLLRRCEK